MNSIKGLIIKDFFNLKSYVKTIIVIMVFYIIMGFINNNLVTFVSIILPLCFGMIGISSFNYDNIAKSDKYILTFPITKRDVVKSRYLHILCLTIVGTILGFILCIIFQSIKEKMLANIIDMILISIGALCGMTLIQAFEIPIIYKYGAEKGRIIQMIVIALLMVGISSITAVIIKISPFSLDDFIYMLKTYGFLIIIAITTIFYIISYKISLKIYSKKEID